MEGGCINMRSVPNVGLGYGLSEGDQRDPSLERSHRDRMYEVSRDLCIWRVHSGRLVCTVLRKELARGATGHENVACYRLSRPPQRNGPVVHLGSGCTIKPSSAYGPLTWWVPGAPACLPASELRPAREKGTTAARRA
jgi:hypothetical protein